MKTNKYNYLTILQGNYGYGWDDLVFRTSREHLKWYRDNEKQALHRIIKRREVNPAHKAD